MEQSIFPSHDKKVAKQRDELKKKSLQDKQILPKLYKGDCIKVMKRSFEDESIDVIVTSPPYNLNIKYGSYKDNKPKEEYLAWISKVFKEIKRVLKPSGSLFLNVGYSNVDPWVSEEVAFAARPYFILQNKMVWAKSLTINKDGKEISWGHFKPINSKRFINCTYEHIYHFTKDGNQEIDKLSIGAKYVHPSNHTRWKSSKGDEEAVRCRGNIWCIPYETISDKEQKGNHPAIFPVQLVEWAIKLHGIKDGMTVLDPFLGTGSTIMACLNLEVMGYGIELDKEYLKYAKDRIGCYGS